MSKLLVSEEEEDQLQCTNCTKSFPADTIREYKKKRYCQPCLDQVKQLEQEKKEQKPKLPKPVEAKPLQEAVDFKTIIAQEIKPLLAQEFSNLLDEIKTLLTATAPAPQEIIEIKSNADIPAEIHNGTIKAQLKYAISTLPATTFCYEDIFKQFASLFELRGTTISTIDRYVRILAVEHFLHRVGNGIFKKSKAF